MRIFVRQTNRDMKLYHGTKIDNVENIVEMGLEPILSNKISHNERLNVAAVYGFDNLKDAIDFMAYDQNEPYYAVFEFESECAVLDTEYEGNAYAVITYENINADLVCTYED